jgi:hypothetical protein
MPFRSSRTPKRPPSNREPERPKKSLEDACLDLKRKYGQELRSKENAVLAARWRVEEDAAMAEVYGPGWKTQMPRWAVLAQLREAHEIAGIRSARGVPKAPPAEPFEDEPEDDLAKVVPIRSARHDRREARERRRKAC